jgi:hypothetical protein
MPFTLAHPAAVVPLRKLSFLHTVPLIIGSLVPDLPYYLPERLGHMLGETHNLTGLLTICLPLGLGILLGILSLRDPLTTLLSARARWVCVQALERFTSHTRRELVAILSILTGAWTHLAWDSFTHQDGWMVARVAALSAPVHIFGWQTEMSHLLQYLSSVFGLAVLASWYSRAAARAPAVLRTDPARGRLRLLLLLVFTAAMLIGAMQTMWRADVLHGSSFYHTTFLVLTRAIAWFVALYFAAGLLVNHGRRVFPQPAR